MVTADSRPMHCTRRLLLIALCVGTGHEIADAAGQDSLECQRIKKQIERIQSLRRAGYSAEKGRKLQARLRELRKLRFRKCR